MEKNNIPCGFCGSNENKFLFNGKDRLHGKSGVFSYVKCSKCGLVYMNPQIGMEELADFYPNDYAPHLSKSDKSKQSQKKMRKKSLLPEDVLQKLNENTVLLDIGCGSGKFLDETKKLTNTQVCGIDISKTAVETAKENFGLDIFHGTIAEAPYEDNSFDLITAWQYLEHIQKPLEVLQKINQLLKPDGICMIGIPNIDSINAKMFKEKWYGLDCPRHLYLYTPETITKLMEKTNFVVTGIHHDPSSKNLIRSLQYFFYGDNYNPKHRDKIKNMPILKFMLSPITRIFALFNKSDNIIVSAKKVSQK